jgi:hypothetical protein
MKKHSITIAAIITIALILSCGLSFAQNSPISKGSMMASGELSLFTTSKYCTMPNGEWDTLGKDVTMTVIQLYPSLSYFITNGLALGGTIEFGRMSWSGESFSYSYSRSNRIFGIGPRIGYYFNLKSDTSRIKGSVYPFLNSELLYSMNKTHAEYSYYSGTNHVYDDTASGLSARLGGGLIVMISNAAGLRFNASYQKDIMKLKYYKEKEKSVTGNRFNFGLGFSVFF